jgi:hypothetical protein
VGSVADPSHGSRRQGLSPARRKNHIVSAAHTLSTRDFRIVLAASCGHPLVTTVRIVSWVAAGACDLLARSGLRHQAALAEAACLFLLVGIVSALLAAVFVLMHQLTIPARRPLRATKVALNVVAVLVMLANVLVRQNRGLDQMDGGTLVLSLLGLGLVAISGLIRGRRPGLHVSSRESAAPERSNFRMMLNRH